MGVFRKLDFIILIGGLVLIWVLFALVMGNDFRPELAVPQSLALLAIYVVIWITRFIRGR